jgi:two-component system NtrC family sensor kinase
MDATSVVPVLIVEDEPSVMAFVRVALERNGYTVESAETGAAALTMLADREYLGVISDMRTPGDVDGAGLYDWLHTNQPEVARKMLFITGDTVNEETARALERTGAPFIEKPFRVSQLMEVVKRIIGEPR